MDIARSGIRRYKVSDEVLATRRLVFHYCPYSPAVSFLRSFFDIIVLDASLLGALHSNLDGNYGIGDRRRIILFAMWTSDEQKPSIGACLPNVSSLRLEPHHPVPGPACV